jgi:hypothetical protein
MVIKFKHESLKDHKEAAGRTSETSSPQALLLWPHLELVSNEENSEPPPLRCTFPLFTVLGLPTPNPLSRIFMVTLGLPDTFFFHNPKGAPEG